MAILLYVLFFLSGAAALVYEVAWVRSLSLVFGGSHLAVTAVLSVFMGGLALGSWWLGRAAERSRNPLRLYGGIELGIAAFAVVFVLLARAYPAVYVPLARAAGDDPVLLTVLRAGFAVAAMIVPTTLMGATLPVLSRFVTGRGESLTRHLSLLYGFNTLGAVAGTLAAGFVLLPGFGLSGSLGAAIATNVAVGLLALSLPGSGVAPRTAPGRPAPVRAAADPVPPPDRADRAVLIGIGAGGFCALGYEVLWTRVLTMVVGTSVYGFTIMLSAFLAGIGAGSAVYGLLKRRRSTEEPPLRVRIARFGAVEAAVGAAALVVTYALGSLPNQALAIQVFVVDWVGSEFVARQVASSVVAFTYVFGPAFLLGIAFPMAAAIHASSRRAVGGAVGEVLMWNTIGALLGAAVSGFVLIFLFGIERSLQLLALANVGLGVWVAASVRPTTAARRLVAAGMAGLFLLLAANPAWGRVWNSKYFAIYRNNQRGAFDSPERIREALENTDVLFFREGVNETISVIRPKGAAQSVVVNGKVVASSMPPDRQCVLALGHIPMLLHPNPKKVFVLGMGTGMTLGAVSVHPELEAVVLAEIEPAVLDAARTFSRFNHDVVNNPKLRVVFNDGRNYLLVTEERFDMITADPIHPWTRGSGYLYTSEYYALAAGRLRPGGIMCQWLPIYELTPRDLATVVKTFSQNFRHVMLWLTHWDAELVGSNEPIRLDLEAMTRRMAHPPIATDLREIEMGSPKDLLSYWIAGDDSLRRFAAPGEINTDDNLRLEFSAPFSVGSNWMARDARALYASRESLLPYLVSADVPHRNTGLSEWARQLSEAGEIYGRAHAAMLGGEGEVLENELYSLRRDYPDYAPGRFLEGEFQSELARTPTLVEEARLPLAGTDGRTRLLVLSAVRMRIGDERGAVVVVDNEHREIYLKQYVDAPAGTLDGRMDELALELLETAGAAYARETASSGGAVPPESRAKARIKTALLERSR